MLVEECPKCVCGANSWNSVGASIGSNLSQQGFSCRDCERPALFLSHGGGAAFLMPEKVPLLVNEHGSVRRPFPALGLKYINEVLLIAWRDRYEKVLKFRKELDDASWKKLCEEHGSIETDYTKIPAYLRETIRTAWREKTYKQYPSQAWQDGGFDTPVLPPQFPASLRGYVMVEKLWSRIDHGQCENLPIPPDPILVHHNEYWDDVFSQVRDRTGIALPSCECEKVELGSTFRRETENEYCGAKNEPWYSFVINGVGFHVGPRKRVDAIKVSSEKGIRTRSIHKLAIDANTSYWSNGDWQPQLGKHPTAKTIEVHAWSKEKTVEYLTVLINEAMLCSNG